MQSLSVILAVFLLSGGTSDVNLILKINAREAAGTRKGLTVLTAERTLRIERELENRTANYRLRKGGYQNLLKLDDEFTGLSVQKLIEEQKTFTIYGENNIVQGVVATSVMKDTPPAFLDATAAIVNANSLQPAGGGLTLVCPTLAETGVCTTKNELFLNEPVAARCTAFLIAPDVVATAGHCARDVFDLYGKRFVFGFQADANHHVRTTFSKGDVYTGTLIDAYEDDIGADWALVRIKSVNEDPNAKPVVRPVLDLSTDSVSVGDRVYIIGYPSGIPIKVAHGAKVMRNDFHDFFTADLDVYGGNSGSPVFSETTNKVIGILVRGDVDYLDTTDELTGKVCRITHQCPDSNKCRGEDITRISVVPKV